MPELLRVMTYNIRHGQGMDNRISLERVAMNIVTGGADLCGIQEVDRYLPRSGMCDQARKLAKLCGMYDVFASNLKLPFFATYGTAILSRWPIIYSHNYPLPGTGEPRGLLKTVILYRQQEISFFTTHLGLKEQERVQQAHFIKNIISQCPTPVILSGDLNEEIDGKAVEILLEDMENCLPAGVLKIPTFPTNQPQKQIDFIFFKGPWVMGDVWTVNSRASDHLPLVATLAGKNLSKPREYRKNP